MSARTGLAFKAGLIRLLIVVGIAVLWQLLPQFGAVPELFLPPLTHTIEALVGGIANYAINLAVTLKEVAISLIFACGGGILCGLSIGSSIHVRRTLLPVVSSLFAVPIVVLYPLFTAWFGIGPESKIVFASVYGFLPTLLNTAAGVQTIDKQLVVVGKSMGATPIQRITRIYLPASIPTVMASMRLGGALVIVGVIFAEMLTSTAGLGFLISKYRTMLDSPHVYAAILVVLAVAVGFDLLLQLAERYTIGWRHAKRG